MVTLSVPGLPLRIRDVSGLGEGGLTEHNVLGGRTICSLQVATNRQEYNKRVYWDRINAGLCPTCGEIPLPERRLCQKCSDRHAAYYKTDKGRESLRGRYRKYKERDPEGWKERQRQYRERNRPRRVEYAKVYKRELRQETFEAYGGAVCQCCGETTDQFLVLDHIYGGGSKHRRDTGRAGLSFYATLRKEGFPSGYQVLCHNCNAAKSLYGICPHVG